MSDQNEPLIPHLGLIVLDLQSAFLKAFNEPANFVNRVSFTLETAKLFDLPTLFTEQRPDILGETIESLLSIQPDAVRIAKTGFSAFTEQAVNDWIEAHSIQHLLVTGLETPICVYQTVLDAINSDIEVTVLSDAVACRREDDAVAALASVRIHGGHVLPGETIFYSILRDSKHPAFKEFTHLVKKYSDK